VTLTLPIDDPGVHNWLDTYGADRLKYLRGETMIEKWQHAKALGFEIPPRATVQAGDGLPPKGDLPCRSLALRR
jgi:hypothetical protein